MKKTYLTALFVCFLLFGGSNAFGQSMFSISQIHDINIAFYDANWDHKLDSLAALNSGTGSGTGRILADVTINGTTLDSCGVRYKGNSSQSANNVKNPFNIDLNYVISGQKYQGKNKIKLANCFTDPSMVREALTYELANRYMDCPRASFVRLAVNGDFIGIYTNTESVDNEFLNEHFGSSNNSFFKCDPVSFELYGDNSNLAYYSDTMAYDTLYDMKSAYGLAELRDLTYELEFNAANIDQFLDVDRALWFLALSSVLVHNDGYTAFAHNFYIYKMDNGLWSIVLWDVNMAFGGLLWNGSNFFPLGENALVTQSPFIHQNNPNFRPLIGQLLGVPKFWRMYVAHYRTLIEENLDNGHYLTRAQFMSDLIAPDVFNEQYNEYTYQEFEDNITTNVGSGFDLRVGLSNLMSQRTAYLNGLSEFQTTRPTFVSQTSNPTEPNPFSLVTFNTEVSNATDVWMGYRYNEFDAFTKVLMYDDGAHNDGAAGDNVYGVDVTILGTEMYYYFYADNTIASRFYPARAEYEFFTKSPKKGLVINELAAINLSIHADLEGDYDDWIELYNSSADPINLGNYYLSDESNNMLKWNLPSYTLAPNDYFIVWADNQVGQAGVHANFKLASAGESLYLSDNLGFPVDVVHFPQQYADITYGRLPNGVGPFDYLYPTFGTANSQAVGLEETPIELQLELSIFPNPASDQVTIKLNSTETEQISIFTLSGKLVKQFKLENGLASISVSEFESGIYLVTTSNGQVQKLVVR